MTVVLSVIRLDGLYMANKNSSKAFLTPEQIMDLSQFINDEFGSNLPEDELIEAIALVLENVPGIESESNRSIQRQIRLIRNQYHGRKPEN